MYCKQRNSSYIQWTAFKGSLMSLRQYNFQVLPNCKSKTDDSLAFVLLCWSKSLNANLKVHLCELNKQKLMH